MDGPTRDPQPFTTASRRGWPWEQLEFPQLRERPGRRRRAEDPVEYKVVTLRDCPLPDSLQDCDCPRKAADYWRLHIATAVSFSPDVESFAVLHLNTRRRVRGHHIVATGTLDTVIVHSREVFRAAIVANSAAIILLHNHPSGDPSPSEADIRVTRELIRAGQLLKIEVLDHVIVGVGQHSSLKSLGNFSW